MLTADRLLK